MYRMQMRDKQTDSRTNKRILIPQNQNTVTMLTASHNNL